MKRETATDMTAWELSRGLVEDSDANLDDAELHAYRDDKLDADERARIETLLCTSPAARARLAELGGVAPAAPPASVRRRVLGGAESAPAPTPWLRLAAAVAIVALGVGAFFRFGGPAVPAPAGAALAALTFDVEVQGLAEVRSNQASAIAYPDTIVRITMSPRQNVSAGLGYAVYATRDGWLRRLDTSAGVRVDRFRGAARISAQAQALVGAGVGANEFYLLAGAQEDLPADQRLADGQTAADALTGPGRHVHVQTLTVIERENEQ